MTANRVDVYDDNKTMRVITPDGNVITLGSARPGGFTVGDVERARYYDFPRGEVGEVRRCRRFHVGGREVIVEVNTGPPTWWLPRIEVKRGEAAVGWLRAVIAVAIRKAPR